jgi:hypothetical protein
MYWDVSANEVSVKVYDDSADSWAETSVASSMSSNIVGQWCNQWSAVQRQSDNHVFFVANNIVNDATSDLKVWELNGVGSITARADVETNNADAVTPDLLIDENTGRLYCFYDDKASSDTIRYRYSDDSGATWSAAQQYSDSAAVDAVSPFTTQSIRAGQTGSIGAIWVDDTNHDLLFNYARSIPAAPSGGGHLVGGRLVTNSALVGGKLVA